MKSSLAIQATRIRRRLAGSLRAEHGGTLIEMAVVLPTFFLMLLGFFNFMFVLFAICDVNYAATTGARYASLHSLTSANPASVTDVQNVIKANLFTLAGNTPTIIVDYSKGTGNYVGQPVGIGVVYAAPNGVGLKNFYITAQAFRIITH